MPDYKRILRLGTLVFKGDYLIDRSAAGRFRLTEGDEKALNGTNWAPGYPDCLYCHA